MQAIEIHKEIETRANKQIHNLVKVESMKIGQWVRQGDIYVTMIESITGKLELKSRQLVIGQTKGSRHIVVDSPNVKIWKGYVGSDKPEFMKGDQIEAKTGFVISHPEHAHISLPCGNYQVTYQMDWKQQDRTKD